MRHLRPIYCMCESGSNYWVGQKLYYFLSADVGFLAHPVDYLYYWKFLCILITVSHIHTHTHTHIVLYHGIKHTVQYHVFNNLHQQNLWITTIRALGLRKSQPTLWQFFLLPVSSTIWQTFTVSGRIIQSYLDPDADPEHRQNLITKSNLPWKFEPNPLVTFCVIPLTNKPTGG